MAPRTFANGQERLGFELILSLSYELFAAIARRLEAEGGDGAPALTGWVPPSALLSPANGAAMAYLQAVGRAFATIAQGAGFGFVPGRRALVVGDVGRPHLHL
jgi:hypothetical protein